jgi:hypothetical protein
MILFFEHALPKPQVYCALERNAHLLALHRGVMDATGLLHTPGPIHTIQAGIVSDPEARCMTMWEFPQYVPCGNGKSVSYLGCVVHGNQDG